ncbi:MAG: cysteine desulfurase family protein [Pseudomonadota bacterium]
MGLDGRRVYLDWNATAPLRPEARAAMLEAMDTLGNPSSVHAEGRAARAIVERARGQVASLTGCDADEIVITSGASEAASSVDSRWRNAQGTIIDTELEHDCMSLARSGCNLHVDVVPDVSGRVDPDRLLAAVPDLGSKAPRRISVTAANSETGVLNEIAPIGAFAREHDIEFVSDAVQAWGRMEISFRDSLADFVLCSAHKIGGPKGVGCLIERRDHPFVPSSEAPIVFGGGQEQGRRSGTENVIGIAGFGAAAVAAKRDLEAGLWDRVEKLRNILEEGLEAAAPDLIIFGRDAPRLPNTSCFAVPGWKGETQVMQLDLAGFAVSAGSACSSGKVRESRVLRAMGFDSLTASSAIRVSLGPTTTEAQIRAFLTAWTTLYRKRAIRAA